MRDQLSAPQLNGSNKWPEAEEIEDGSGVSKPIGSASAGDKLAAEKLADELSRASEVHQVPCTRPHLQQQQLPSPAQQSQLPAQFAQKRKAPAVQQLSTTAGNTVAKRQRRPADKTNKLQQIQTDDGRSSLGESPVDNVCAACSKPIRERYLLMALDKPWHEDCLKCACCDCRLAEVGSSLFLHSDKILCRRDFARIFGPAGSCAACKQPIPPHEMVMRANEHAYHMECFRCLKCQRAFCVGDPYYLSEAQRILCVECHEPALAAGAPLPPAAPPTAQSAPQPPAQPLQTSIQASRFSMLNSNSSGLSELPLAADQPLQAQQEQPQAMLAPEQVAGPTQLECAAATT